jgi:hypothetical protein
LTGLVLEVVEQVGVAAGSVAPLANLIGKNVAIALALVKSRATGAPHAKGLVGNTSAAGGGNEFRALPAKVAKLSTRQT